MLRPKLRSLLKPMQLPLRLRLTIWYLLTFALILLLSGFVLYWQVQHELAAQIDTSLQLAASQTQLNVDVEDNHPAFQNVEEVPDLSLRLHEDMAIFLLDFHGVVHDRIGRDEELQPFLPTVGFQTYSVHDDSLRVYTERVRHSGSSESGWIQVVQSQESVLETLTTLQLQLLGGLPLALALAGIGGYFLASHALAPINSITRTAQKINSNDLAQRIDYVGPPDEIGRLAATFDNMLERLQAAFERERRFAGDAAHELRTPLAALKGRIGVTLSQPRKLIDYTNTLQEMEQQVDRLVRLSNDLLFMARLGQEHLHLHDEAIELDALLGAVVDQVRPLAESKTIAITLTTGEPITIHGEIDLLIRLFLNLLDNAVKYTPEGGRVIVDLHHFKTLSTVEITVSDSGTGVPPEHLPHLFERFYRVEESRTRIWRENGEGGAGLGLAIAHEIATVHGGTLTVQSTVGQGTTFTVRLPQSRLDQA